MAESHGRTVSIADDARGARFVFDGVLADPDGDGGGSTAAVSEGPARDGDED